MKGVLCTTASALFVAVSGHGNMIQPRPRSSHNQVLDARNQVRPGGTFCCAPRAISRQVILLRASSPRASLESQCHASSSPAPSAVRPAAPPSLSLVRLRKCPRRLLSERELSWLLLWRRLHWRSLLVLPDRLLPELRNMLLQRQDALPRCSRPRGGWMQRPSRAYPRRRRRRGGARSPHVQH
jgi:hypothetical protein